MLFDKIRYNKGNLFETEWLSLKQIIPSYYPLFSCIADRCQHSCCIGWEIGIDDASAARYRAVEGPFGERLRASMTEAEDGWQFLPDEHERCPFLNGQGLCDLILTLGEEALCDICDAHPRFRYDYADRTEWGLGLCCEAAAALILSQEEPVTFSDDGTLPPDPDEAAMLRLRANAIAVAQDRSLSVAEREERLLRSVGGRTPTAPEELAEWYLPLERLDPAWETELNRLQTVTPAPSTVSDAASEQLLVYFLYRQIPPSLEDGCFKERMAFAVLSVRLIRALAAVSENTLFELARMYSAEIEYSDENIACLLTKLARHAAA